jgi:hypothetical protein
MQRETTSQIRHNRIFSLLLLRRNLCGLKRHISTWAYDIEDPRAQSVVVAFKKISKGSPVIGRRFELLGNELCWPSHQHGLRVPQGSLENRDPCPLSAPPVAAADLAGAISSQLNFWLTYR